MQIKPCSAEYLLFLLSRHLMLQLLKQLSASNDEKMTEKKHKYRTDNSTETILLIFSAILFGFAHARNRIYWLFTKQGLKIATWGGENCSPE